MAPRLGWDRPASLLTFLRCLSGGYIVISRKIFTAAILVAAGWLVASGSFSSGQEAKKFKGRLPAYYGDIVTQEQREKIYQIQSLFAKQKETLEAQLNALKEKEEQEIENVLSAPQKAKLKQVQEEAAAKRKKKADEKKAAENGEATDSKAPAKKTK